MRAFRLPILLSVALIALSGILWGAQAALIVTILAVLEISFSFDNAVVNAKILGRMSEKWQKLFLTVGILIAVFGMRLVFPLVIVALAAHLNPFAAIQLAGDYPLTASKT